MDGSELGDEVDLALGPLVQRVHRSHQLLACGFTCLSVRPKRQERVRIVLPCDELFEKVVLGEALASKVSCLRPAVLREMAARHSEKLLSIRQVVTNGAVSDHFDHKGLFHLSCLPYRLVWIVFEAVSLGKLSCIAEQEHNQEAKLEQTVFHYFSGLLNILIFRPSL